MVAKKGSKPSPWSQAELRDALKSECWNKCMYCEVDPDDGSYPAVEHIKPKESFPDLVLQWENLGWCCTRCNTNKGSYWKDHKDLKLLNPYEDDPADHIKHSGPVIVPSLGSERGKNTIRKLKLNRGSLITSKARRIQDLDDRIQLWNREDDPDKKSVLEDDVLDCLSQESEFCAMLRAFATFQGFPN
ncbi:HNH endonuclease [Rhodococcus sp. ACPA4]|uniref:HNH endonuclease n=1 Tax=Rhodococcus sp. ACPA4 TaxID=2028571 RepID=UPI00359C4266